MDCCWCFGLSVGGDPIGSIGNWRRHSIWDTICRRAAINAWGTISTEIFVWDFCFGLNVYRFVSMFVFLSMLVLGMSEHAIGNYVLAGPRTPYWGCKRGCDGNYASRIKCRCGAAAPTTIMHKAKRNAPTEYPKLTEHPNSLIFNLFKSTWTTQTRTEDPLSESSFARQ